jgi:hypothetical protein
MYMINSTDRSSIFDVFDFQFPVVGNAHGGNAHGGNAHGGNAHGGNRFT